ncbi:alpha/beta hydrolase [Tabrizicola sp.]|uniref:alpha/beta hydrolase n=1 Tax=Tabrizicola sp. TaxID=2005166 RepID=UPI003F32DE81
MRRAGPTTGASIGLVLAHGRGGSSADILGLLDHAGLPEVAAIAPDAPGGSWWPTSFLAPEAVIGPHAESAVATMETAIATLEAEGIPRASIWLGGFSQGAVLALETFARKGEGLAGVFALSGGLIGTGDAEGDPDPGLYGHGPKRFGYQGRRDRAKVWMSVHERDPHIPLARVRDSATVLTGMGAEVMTQIYPGAGHAVMRDDIEQLRRWLNR